MTMRALLARSLQSSAAKAYLEAREAHIPERPRAYWQDIAARLASDARSMQEA